MIFFDLTSKISTGLIVIYLISESFLRKRLDRPVFVKLIRVFSLLCLLAIIPLGFELLMNVFKFVSGLQHGNPFNFLFFSLRILVPSFFLSILLIWLRRAWWYYIRHDNQTIQSRWHMQKYFAASNKKKEEEAYHHLQKASELQTDSVFIWSMLAWYNEFIFEKSNLADEYLAKARQTLAALPNATAKDKAFVESAVGTVLLRRHQVDEGLALLKAACDLDPSDFNKEKYDRAVQWVNQPDDKDEDDASESGDAEPDQPQQPDEIKFPWLLFGLLQVMPVLGIFLLIILSLTFGQAILDAHSHSIPKIWYARYLSVALLCGGLIAGAALCLKIKRSGWHILTFSMLVMALGSSDFFQRSDVSKGFGPHLVIPALLLTIFTASYVYLFTDRPRAFLNVTRPKRCQIFSLHIALYLLLYFLFSLL